MCAKRARKDAPDDMREWLLPPLWEIVWSYGQPVECAMWCSVPVFSLFRRLLPFEFSGTAIRNADVRAQIGVEAARAGVATFQWSINRLGARVDDDRICAEAADRGDDELLRLAFKLRCPTVTMQRDCARRGDVARLQMAFRAGQPIRDTCWHYAATDGQIAVMEWLRDIGCPATQDVSAIWMVRRMGRGQRLSGGRTRP